MAKKQAKKSEKKSPKPAADKKPAADASAAQPAVPVQPNNNLPPLVQPNANLPKEVEEKLKQIKVKLDKFQKAIIKKFDKYIMGISLLPPAKDTKEEKEKINVLVLVDDRDSKRMSKIELRDKLASIMSTMATEIDKKMVVQTIILSELWQSCYDGKTDLLQMIAMGAPVYDLGMLSAVKIAEIHKNMVLKKFERYIVSYVLAGSLVQGRATPSSDIDVWIVIDDTDVKKMTRVELKDKLRSIIIGMGLEAGDITGIRNKLNIQVYILTDFWDNLKEANPIIFTLLRDGVPFFDRGIFMPWKQLLRMGKIKPSAEAIDMFMSTGEQMLDRVAKKLVDIGMEDTFYAILTPSQAAIMLYGLPPPTPRETPEVLDELFVKKEKLLEPKYVEILKRNIQMRKDLEHGTKKEVSGKEVDKLLSDSKDYLKRIKKLFEQIEVLKDENSMLQLYENIVTMIRDVLRLEGIEKAADVELVSLFENELISKGKVPAKYLRVLNDIVKAKKDYDAKKLTKIGVENVRKASRDFIKFLVEYVQRKRGQDLERARIRVKYGGEQYAEVLLLENIAFIVHDMDAEEKTLTKAPITAEGGLGPSEPTTLEELEKHVANAKIPPKVFIREQIFEQLKKLFGGKVEILLSN